jgi:catechol 2,3-dioxygenase-like lactoylglutathione lyase family enzyme
MEHEIDHLVREFEAGKLTRRDLVRHMAAFAAAVAAGGAAVAQETPAADEPAGPMFQATRLNHMALRVTDVPRARDWYVKHLGLTVTNRDSESSCFLTFGSDFLALFRGDTPGMDHYCYSVKDFDPAAAMETLAAYGIDGVRRGNRIYFPDADGMTVQIAEEEHTP